MLLDSLCLLWENRWLFEIEPVAVLVCFLSLVPLNLTEGLRNQGSRLTTRFRRGVSGSGLQKGIAATTRNKKNYRNKIEVGVFISSFWTKEESD